VNKALSQELLDAVYRSALEPQAWDDVMQLMKRGFPSSAQTFYFLHLQPRRIQPVSLAGIEAKWVRNFNEFYFAPDNPWIRLTKRLHRPGVVRTTERLEHFTQDPGVLDRSTYYNEWMKPQSLKHNMGNTLLAEGGVVANITLFRPPDMKTFSAAEVRGFEELSTHMTRSLRMAMRLERPQDCPASAALFDAMPHAIAVIDAQRRMLYANAAMESVLRRKAGLGLRQGELNATQPGVEQKLAAYVARTLQGGGGPPAGGDALILPQGEQGYLTLHAMPVVGHMGHLLPKATLLLMATEHSGREAMSRTAMGQLFGCTPSEARLAELLAQGFGLRHAAQQMNITYGTARVYLKIVFDKTGARTQAQLVARLLGSAGHA
jgi:DNA-binding CsgD family transcriptional regulator/PAS domain-containing protein